MGGGPDCAVLGIFILTADPAEQEGEQEEEKLGQRVDRVEEDFDSPSSAISSTEIACLAH